MICFLQLAHYQYQLISQFNSSYCTQNMKQLKNVCVHSHSTLDFAGHMRFKMLKFTLCQQLGAWEPGLSAPSPNFFNGPKMPLFVRILSALFVETKALLLLPNTFTYGRLSKLVTEFAYTILTAKVVPFLPSEHITICLLTEASCNHSLNIKNALRSKNIALCLFINQATF